MSQFLNDDDNAAAKAMAIPWVFSKKNQADSFNLLKFEGNLI